MFSAWKLLSTKLPRCELLKHPMCQKKFDDQLPVVYPIRNFHWTAPVRLRTLYSEGEQKQITDFINELNMDDNRLVGKFRRLQKIVQSRSENGPIHDVNDLLGKYGLTSKSAVKLCSDILNHKNKPKPTKTKQTIPKTKKGHGLSRKLMLLRKSISPDVHNPQLISKFTVVTVGEKHIGFSQLEMKEHSWQNQQMSDWNALDTSGLPLIDIILKLWKTIPRDEFYVTYCDPLRFVSPDQNRFFGGVLSILCAKNIFNDVVCQKFYHVIPKAPARHFNLIVGSEIVSPQSMVHHKLHSHDSSTPDDHTFSQSLSELSFSDIACDRYSELNDDLKETLSQSLLVGKLFIELLKAVPDHPQK